MSGLKLEQVSEGLLFPEGPVAMADGSVIVVEIRGGRPRACGPTAGTRRSRSWGRGPMGLPSAPTAPCTSATTGNLCFGGADMRDAWITCSSTGKLYRCRWPRPGFKLPFNA